MNTETTASIMTRDALNLLPVGNPWTVVEKGVKGSVTAHYSSLHAGEHGQQVTYETRDAKNKVVDRGIVYRDPAKGAEADQLIWESSMKKESGRLVFRRLTLQWVWTVTGTDRRGSQTPGN